MCLLIFVFLCDWFHWNGNVQFDFLVDYLYLFYGSKQKNLREKCFRKNAPEKFRLEYCPPRNCSPSKLPTPENCPFSWNFLWFFSLILFFWKFPSVSNIYYHSIYFFDYKQQFVYSIFFYDLFSCEYIIDFHLWYLMLNIYWYVTNNTDQPYLAIKTNCRKASVTLCSSHNTQYYRGCLSTQI